MERIRKERGGNVGKPNSSAPVIKTVDIDKKAENIAKSSGLPLPMARQVAVGSLDLNEAIKRLAFQDEVNGLIQRHGFNRALATQIALGQVSKEAMLARRRVDEHLAAYRDHTFFEDALKGGLEITLGVMGRKILRARIRAVEKYEVVVMDLDASAESTFHKLQIKYAYNPTDAKKVRKAMVWDKLRKERVVEPQARPQDRYACSDRRLGLAMDAKTEVEATLIEGEVFSGQIGWVARYEFGLRTRQGGEVVICRHALDNLSGD